MYDICIDQLRIFAISYQEKHSVQNKLNCHYSLLGIQWLHFLANYHDMTHQSDNFHVKVKHY